MAPQHRLGSPHQIHQRQGLGKYGVSSMETRVYFKQNSHISPLFLVEVDLWMQKLLDLSIPSNGIFIPLLTIYISKDGVVSMLSLCLSIFLLNISATRIETS